ncbi:retinol dehydrogenase 11-like isoform X1 [Macrobrachium rosenbergii]|uniref:retinol dehydrogenase 11-like isoform X1 n=1 Tax=Macrobrachium rosenbergii TaxID=79674 RepID=UPI0034D79613
MLLWIVGIISFIVAVRVIHHRRSGICPSKRLLYGKTAIVTGSSAGIGKETARDLARRGARVILACRNVAKAQRIADDIIGTTGNGQVYVKQLDTSDLSSVRRFAKDIIDNEKELHILVNNAGISAPKDKQLTSDGLELTMATNHFGHFLLTNMLLNLLKKSAPSRVVNVSSIAHSFCKHLVADDLNYENTPYPGHTVSYGQSKLANVLFTVELAERMKDTGVTTNCLHPGFVSTEIFYKEGVNIITYSVGLLFKLIGKDETLGAQTSIHLAVSEEVEKISGEYFADCKISPRSDLAKDRGLAKKLWEVSETLVNLSQEDLNYGGK